MIAYVQGRLEHILENSAVVDNAGLGYEINISPRTLGQLPPLGGDIRLYTFLQVKEDDAALYGFVSLNELRMFRRLINVTGVGPKLALGILSAMEPSQIALSIVAEDINALSRCPGVGRKTAQRMVLELKDRLRGSNDFGDGLALADPQQALAHISGEKQDAADALSALGYGRAESLKAVAEVSAADGDGLAAEQILKLALRRLTRI